MLREALITSDSPALAKLLRSYADSSRKAAVVEKRLPAAPGKRPTGESSYAITVSVSAERPEPYVVSVPIAKDDLDLAHATVPAGLHVVAWKR